MGSQAVRISLDLDDDDVVQQAIEQCCGDHVIAEDLPQSLKLRLEVRFTVTRNGIPYAEFLSKT